MKHLSKSPIDNKSALLKVMAWRRTGDKPLPEPMLTQFTDAYMYDFIRRWVKFVTGQYTYLLNVDKHTIIIISACVLTHWVLHKMADGIFKVYLVWNYILIEYSHKFAPIGSAMV